MTKLAPEWVRTRDPVIRSPARYRWTTAPAPYVVINASDMVTLQPRVVVLSDVQDVVNLMNMRNVKLKI